MLVILADDLTGALDSAAPFAGRGIRTDVALNLDAITGI
ncbi:MAG: four-carbon acid sugar kinase family protein, partial [Rhizobiaceae bacterium]